VDIGAGQLCQGMARRRWVRAGAEAGFDVLAWITALLAAARVARAIAPAQVSLAVLWRPGLAVCLVVPGCGLLAGLYRGRYQRGSFDEVAAVVVASAAAVLCLALTAPVLMTGQQPPPQAAVLAGAAGAALAMLGGRYVAFAARLRSQQARLLRGGTSIEGVRDPRISDLLGRRPIEIDLASIASHFAGKRILVTGAGGSIGSELCRQLHRLSPAKLILLDRDESALHALELTLHGHGLLVSDDTVLANIRDTFRVREIFTRFRPEIVFHAAALKHLPLLERHPAEAVLTNVRGTLAVLDAAVAAGVESFVNISTDKAANPVSVLGYSKRIAERLTAQVAGSTGGTYLSVRFGNVLGSRGSVLTALSAQVAAGGPVTVTHPEVSRYFMTADEAVQLVLQAAVIGHGGEALVLDMGEPVRIADIARRLASASVPPAEIVFSGLRPGEKLVEDLLGSGEADHRPCHPLISQVAVPPLAPALLTGLDPEAGADELRAALARCAQAPAPRALSLVSAVPGAGTGAESA
jgi:nucleoside-diphosphate-sugar epimerase